MHRQDDQKFLDITLYPEYEKRNIMPLKPISTWTEEEVKLQLTYNRILQPEYLEYDRVRLINAAKNTQQDWLTDFVFLKMEAALYFNICADLITYYQVPLEASNELANEIYKKLIKDPQLLEIQKQVKEKISEEKELLRTKAIKMLQKTFPDLKDASADYHLKLSDFILIETGKRRKELTNDYLDLYFSEKIDRLIKEKNILRKPIYSKGLNNDYCILGAAGSGKSTITRKYLNNEDQLKYVALCTDDYRGFYLPATEYQEKHLVEQRFILTQDSAYLVKELIERRLRPEKSILGRANIYIDGMRLEQFNRELLEHSRSVLSLMACLSNVSVVPKRVHDRAEYSKSPADSKRHFNTTSLLASHQMASQRILTCIPDECKTILYDTNIKIGENPIEMGVIESYQKNPRIFVKDLARFGDYIGKANVNIEADFGGMLFFDRSKSKYHFTYNAFYKAEQILQLIPKSAYQPKEYEILLSHSSEAKEACLRVYQDKVGNFKIDVLHKEHFAELLTNNKNKKQLELIQALIMLVCYGKRARSEVEVLGKKGAFRMAMTLLKLDEYLPLKVLPYSM